MKNSFSSIGAQSLQVIFESAFDDLCDTYCMFLGKNIRYKLFHFVIRDFFDCFFSFVVLTSKSWAKNVFHFFSQVKLRDLDLCPSSEMKAVLNVLLFRCHPIVSLESTFFFAFLCLLMSPIRRISGGQGASKIT